MSLWTETQSFFLLSRRSVTLNYYKFKMQGDGMERASCQQAAVGCFGDGVVW